MKESPGYNPSLLSRSPAPRRRDIAWTVLVHSLQWCPFLSLVPSSPTTSPVSTTTRKAHPTNMNGLELDRRDDLPIPYQNSNESEKYAYRQASGPQTSQIPLASEPGPRKAVLRPSNYHLCLKHCTGRSRGACCCCSGCRRLAGCEERALESDFTHLLNRISS